MGWTQGRSNFFLFSKVRSHSAAKKTVVMKKVKAGEWVKETKGTNESKNGGMMGGSGTGVVLSLLSDTCESLILLFLLFTPDSHLRSGRVRSFPNDWVLLNYLFIGFFKPRLPLNRHKTVVASKILTNKLLGSYIFPLKAKKKQLQVPAGVFVP